MLFVLGKLAYAVLRPSALIVLAGCVGLLARRRPFGRKLVGASLLSLLAIMLFPVAQWVEQPLEDRFPVPRLPEHVAGIVVLGGAFDLQTANSRGRVTLNAEAERMTDFVALARRYPEARLAFTGGIGDLIRTGHNEGDYARTLIAELGIGRPVVIEDQSRTTIENAEFLSRLVKPAPGETWILVTSAAHMPRSVGLFRHAGWTVLPWPVAYKTGRGWDTWATGSLGLRLFNLDWASHEWAGLLVQWLLGRSDRLFPGPAQETP